MDVHRTVAQDLSRLGEVCAKMGSPFFGTLLERAAAAYETDATLRDLLDRHADRSRIGLRLGGAAHFRALRGRAPGIAAHYPSTGGDGNVDAAWEAVLADIHGATEEYDRLFERQVQTNEVARALPVLGAMLALAHDTRLPLRIFEIGSSAGLVLNFDRYHYTVDGWTWGDERSPVHLRNRTTSGTPPHLDAALTVTERQGCDLHPLDASDPVHADTLLGFIWPDQQERFERLRAAIAVAREHPLHIVQGDGIAWVRLAAQPCEGAATVVLHTVITEHMTADVRASLRESIDELAAHATPGAPFAWARMEISERAYETRLTRWPGAVERLIATSDGHAQNLRWCGALGEPSC
jgi:hypothetical protein